MARLRALLFAFAVVSLGGCTFFFDVQDSVQPDPSPDAGQRKTIAADVKKITSTMKQAGASEISEVGPNEAQSGPENWTVCSRTQIANEPRYFTFFVKDGKVANWRASVINDHCETRMFTSFDRYN